MRWLQALAMLAAPLTAFAAPFLDDRHTAVTLDAPASRIVTLAPHLAELAFAAGAGDRVVGVSGYTDWPEAARQLPLIAVNGRVDLERLALAKPDLVLAWQSGNPALEVARVERRGIPVVVTEIRTFADIARWIRAIGVLAGTSAIAEPRAQAFEREIARLAARHAERAPVSVFYEIWHTPLLTVNGEHLISRVLELCGGRNVLAAAPSLTPAVSLEQLLAKQPDAILIAAPPAIAAQSIAAWRIRRSLHAVRQGALYVVDPALVERMGPRIVEGIDAVCATLDEVRGKALRR
jgi:iron complex transport system substrate-binding protein